MSLVEVLSSASWRLQAACLGYPTAWWFPEKGDFDTLVRAVRICKTCPVIVECAADAQASRERFGIRAGRSQDVMRSRRRRPEVRQGSRSCYQSGCDHAECRAENAVYIRRRRRA